DRVGAVGVVARRAGGRPRRTRDDRARRSRPPVRRRARDGGALDRTRRRLGAAGVRPHRGARLRPQDRGGNAGRGPQRSGRRRGVSRRGISQLRRARRTAEPAHRGRLLVSVDRGSLLECRGLAAGYGAVAVVRDLALRVEAGGGVALLEPNGAGKPTTLLPLAGELPAIAGDIVFRGVATKAPLFRRARR